MNKKYILIISLAILIALITAGVVRVSFVDVNKISPDTLGEYELLSVGGISEDNISFSRFLSASEFIVSGIALNERKFLHGASLEAFKVVSVYKGDSSLKDKTIYIFEPSFFDFNNRTFNVYCGYNLMKNGEEYILFLKKWPYSGYMRYNPFYKNKDIYILSHNSGIDKYNINNILFENYVSEKQKYYKEIQQYDFIAYNKEEIAKYNEIKIQVLASFSNSRTAQD